MRSIDIAVVGGGASGLTAALCARREGPGLRVAVLERGERCGRKILSTGNGRCNLTNMRAAEGGYHGAPELTAAVMRRCPPQEVLRFFEGLGLRTVIEDEGRVYPLCGQAAAVLDVLRLACAEARVEEICSFDVSFIKRQGSGFIVSARDGRRLDVRRVIVCAGGMAAPKIGGTDAGCALLGALGHHLVPRRPALTQIETDPDAVRACKGLRFSGGAGLVIDGHAVREERGEILFTDFGLSGIAVMQLSRDAGDALRSGRRVEIALRILPDDPDRLTDVLRGRCQRSPQRETAEFLTGLVAKRIGQQLCKQAGIAPLSRRCETISDGELRRLAALLTDWRLEARGVRGFESAQVTAGGADARSFRPDTLESTLVPGLYAAGEVLDVDGDCGGYNLQWAWASGMLSGRSAASSLAVR